MKEQLKLDITGMTCAACSTRIEKVLNKMDSVEANVNLAMESAAISFDKELVSSHDIITKIEKLGYEAKEKVNRNTKQQYKEEEIKQKKRMFLLSVILSIPLLYTMLAHLPVDLGLPMPHILMNPWFQLLLATPVQFYIGGQFYIGAFKALKNKSANMDVLVSLGTSAAYFYSLAEGLKTIGNPNLYATSIF